MWLWLFMRERYIDRLDTGQQTQIALQYFAHYKRNCGKEFSWWSWKSDDFSPFCFKEIMLKALLKDSQIFEWIWQRTKNAHLALIIFAWYCIFLSHLLTITPFTKWYSALLTLLTTQSYIFTQKKKTGCLLRIK